MKKTKTVQELLNEALNVMSRNEMFNLDYDQYPNMRRYDDIFRVFEGLSTYLYDIGVFMPNPQRNSDFIALVEEIRFYYQGRDREISDAISKAQGALSPPKVL